MSHHDTKRLGNTTPREVRLSTYDMNVFEKENSVIHRKYGYFLPGQICSVNFHRPVPEQIVHLTTSRA